MTIAMKQMSIEEAEDIERAEQAFALYYNDGCCSEARDYLDFVFDNRPPCEPVEMR